MKDVFNGEMFKTFEMYFPSISREVVGCYKNDDFSLILKTDAGETFMYDDFEHTIRMLPRDSSDLTEDQCRHEFGVRLRRLLYLKGMTQYELSERTGIQRTQLTRYIMGKSSPSFYVVDKIAKGLGCSIDELRYI